MRRWIALFICMASTAFGWKAELSTDPQIARIGQPVTLTLTIQGLRNPPPPDKIHVDGLRASLFSSRSSAVKFSIGTYNQQVNHDAYSQQVSYSCSLVAEKTGEFQIPLTYSYKGETKKLNTTLKVLAGGTDQPTQLSQMFFAKLTANKESIYVHEPVDLQLEIYTIRESRITDQINLSNLPESGLEELKWSELTPIQRVQDNRIYTVRRFQCRTQPLTAGTFNFEPSVTVQAVVPRSQRRTDPFFDGFFGRTQTQSIPLEVAPFTLKVLPLPTEGKPAGFSEGVGTFDFSVENIPTEVLQGDPITVRMHIRGNGNLKGVKAPVFKSGNGIKTYESTRTTNDDAEVVFEQVLMLNDPALKELPALTFTWFNPQTRKYDSVTRGPFPVSVKPNGAATAKIITESPTPIAHTEILGQDIMYLKPLPKKWRRLDEPFWYARKRYLYLLPLPALLTTLLGLILRKIRKVRTDLSELRKRGALKASSSALKAADKAARQNDPDTFFREIWRGISIYFGDKLTLSAGEISEARLLDVLGTAELQPEQLKSFKSLLQICEQNRYGMKPNTGTEEMQQIAATVHSIIKHCERKLK